MFFSRIKNTTFVKLQLEKDFQKVNLNNQGGPNEQKTLSKCREKSPDIKRTS
jgi:hypothetical protein